MPPDFVRDRAVLAVLDASPNNVVAVDPDGVICYVNERTLATFGYAADELIGQQVEVLVPERLAERHRRHVRGFVRDPRARPMGAGSISRGDAATARSSRSRSASPRCRVRADPA